MSKNIQHMKTGKFGKSAMRDIEFGSERSRGYIVESAKRDASGRVIDPSKEPRIIEESNFVKACDDILTVNSDGTIQYKACFAAGTLVLTKNGAMPIERIRVGDFVLSQPELGGERAYRRVVDTVRHTDKEIYLVQCQAHASQTKTSLLATDNHPFWVQGQGWTAVESLQAGQKLQLADGGEATLTNAQRVYRTQHPHIYLAQSPLENADIAFEWKEGTLVMQELTTMETCLIGEALRTDVYNFEVEGFHTYYVGEVGIWVHNTNCNETVPGEGQAKAIESVFDKSTNKKTIDAAIEEKRARETGQCFDGETHVHRSDGPVEIKGVVVGDLVLSRCEKTGERAYRKVLQVFKHEYDYDDPNAIEIPQYDVYYLLPNGRQRAVSTTREHPFWVKGQGWIEAAQLLPGQELEICDLEGLGEDYDHWRKLGPYQEVIFKDNGWTAKVVDVKATQITKLPVYNLEVEEFHTYFVDNVGLWVHNKNLDKPIDVVLGKSTPDAKPIGGKDTKIRPGNSQSDIGENNAAHLLAQHDVEVVNIPDTDANEAGKLPSGRPDRIVDGRTVDIYSPEGDNLRTVWDTIAGKSVKQSSDIVVYLDHSDGITREMVLNLLENRPEGARYGGPIPTLRDLIIISNETVTVRRYPETELNRPTYARYEVTPGGGFVRKTEGNIIPESGFVDTRRKSNEEVEVEGGAYNLHQLTSEEIVAELAIAKRYWESAGIPLDRLSNLTVDIGELPNRVAAQTIGTQITLSKDSAGWGWFVDATPAAQEEFSATDVIDQFTANPGSAAEGKLDLLTVLIHELGHVLGLGHTDDGPDIMSRVLTPGVRRLPDASDIAGLHHRLESSSRTLSESNIVWKTMTNAIAVNADFAQEIVVPNLPMYRAQYSIGSDGRVKEWELFGNALSDADGNFHLAENMTSNAHVTQSFAVKQGDRYLSFTVANNGMQANGVDADGNELGPDVGMKYSSANAMRLKTSIVGLMRV